MNGSPTTGKRRHSGRNRRIVVPCETGTPNSTRIPCLVSLSTRPCTVRRCPMFGRWVSTFSDPHTPIGAEPKSTYFLVRWRPPCRFTLVDLCDHPSPACSEKDHKADDDRTLFPVRE